VSIKSAARSAANRCSSRKLGYPTREKARPEAARLAKHYGEPLSVYRCPECRLFHLTRKRSVGLTTNGTPRRTA
jgi:hypothetical protein